MVTSMKKEKSTPESVLLPLVLLALVFLRQKRKLPFPLKFLQTVNVKRKGFLKCMFCLSIGNKN